MTNQGGSSSFKKSISRQSSSSIPDGYQNISVWLWLKQLTALFVGDIEPQNDYHASTSRQVGRIGVTFVTLVAFAAMAVALFTNAPSSRTVRDWASNKDSQGQMAYNFVPSDAQRFRNDTNQICFCRSTNINWPDYVAFFPLTLPPKDGNTNLQPTRGLDISTDAEAFCESTTLDPGSPQKRPLSLAFNACLLMVQAAVARNISQTCLQGASLINPSLLNDTIASRVTGGLDQIWWNYRILQSLNNVTKGEYDQITSLHSLWTVMVAQFNQNHMSSNQDYWNAATSSGSSRVLEVINGSQLTALGMEVQWHTYANLCNPPFCDTVKQNSWFYTAFLAVAQVGGLSTLVLVFVRLLFWPALRQTLGWPLLSRREKSSSTSSKVTPILLVDQTSIPTSSDCTTKTPQQTLS